jgi:hypothetical protein
MQIPEIMSSIEDAASILEETGVYKNVTIASMDENDGHFVCRLKIPSYRSKSGFTFYPQIDKETVCLTKKEAIIRCLRHIQLTGCIDFSGQFNSSVKSNSKNATKQKQKLEEDLLKESRNLKNVQDISESSVVGSIDTELTIDSEKIVDDDILLPPDNPQITIPLSTKITPPDEPVLLLF